MCSEAMRLRGQAPEKNEWDSRHDNWSASTTLSSDNCEASYGMFRTPELLEAHVSGTNV